MQDYYLDEYYLNKRLLDPKAVGARIRALRKERGWTQEQLAEKIDVIAPLVGHIERGLRKPSLENLMRFCRAFDTDAHYLLFGFSHSFAPPDPQKTIKVADLLTFISATASDS